MSFNDDIQNTECKQQKGSLKESPREKTQEKCKPEDEPEATENKEGTQRTHKDRGTGTGTQETQETQHKQNETQVTRCGQENRQRQEVESKS